MKFLDANPFIYAYYRPRRVSGDEKKLKEQAQEIISKINRDEKVVTTVVHISEVTNILKHGMPLKELLELVTGIFNSDNIEVVGVSREDYLVSAQLASEFKLDPNDSLAVHIMRRMEIDGIYSFDTDFDKVEGINRLP